MAQCEFGAFAVGEYNLSIRTNGYRNRSLPRSCGERILTEGGAQGSLKVDGEIGIAFCQLDGTCGVRAEGAPDGCGFHEHGKGVTHNGALLGEQLECIPGVRARPGRQCPDKR